MRIKKDWNYKKTILGGLIISSVIIFIAIIVFVLILTPLGGKRRTTAIVESVARTSEGSSAMVKFNTADGKTYVVKYPRDAEDLAYRDEVVIYYKISNPNEVSNVFPSLITPVLFLIIGIGILAIVLSTYHSIKKKAKAIAYCKEKGQKYEGKIVKIKIINNKNTGYLVCIFKKGNDNKIVNSDVLEFIDKTDKDDLLIDVYYLNDDKYYIDLEKYKY